MSQLRNSSTLCPLLMSSEKPTSVDRKETAHKANAVSSRVWLGDQCGHSRLEEVLDRHENSSSEDRQAMSIDEDLVASAAHCTGWWQYRSIQHLTREKQGHGYMSFRASSTRTVATQGACNGCLRSTT